MATLEELKDGLKEALHQRGILDPIRAKIRSEIFFALDSSPPKANNNDIPPENYIIDELILEYLEFNKYHHSASVFAAESSHPQTDRLAREVLAHECGVLEEAGATSRRLPLLYSLLQRSHKTVLTQKDKHNLQSTRLPLPGSVQVIPPQNGKLSIVENTTSIGEEAPLVLTGASTKK